VANDKSPKADENPFLNTELVLYFSLFLECQPKPYAMSEEKQQGMRFRHLVSRPKERHEFLIFSAVTH
jgi:hypothetical protein